MYVPTYAYDHVHTERLIYSVKEGNNNCSDVKIKHFLIFTHTLGLVLINKIL